MAKIVTAVFDESSNVQLAVQDLVNHGIFREDISVQATQGANGREFCIDVSTKAAEGGVIGTIFGIVLGAATAYLAAAGYIAIPGVSFGHHSLLMCTIAGTAAGAICGLLSGLLIGATVPEYESNLYPVDERHSGILLGVYCHQKREDEVRTLLQAASGKLLRSRSVPTEPIRLHTTTIDRNKAGYSDDLISRAVHATESAAIMRKLQSAKSNLTNIMESISQLESELAPISHQLEATANQSSKRTGQAMEDTAEGKTVSTVQSPGPREAMQSS